MTELKANITRIGNQYIGRRIDRNTASGLLAQLGLPPAQVTQTLAGWDADLFANVKHLTPAQIVNAFHYNVISQAEAMTGLEGDGYTPYQAWVLLSEREHAPLPNMPAPPASGIL